MTKGNMYAGSTKVKHRTDAMMEFRRDKEAPEFTYIEYTKNRDGAVKMRQYFKITAEGISYESDPVLDTEYEEQALWDDPTDENEEDDKKSKKK